jgi:hypothetical protein
MMGTTPSQRVTATTPWKAAPVGTPRSSPTCPGPVSVDLISGEATGAGTDTLAAIENVWGSGGDDTLLGDAGRNSLFGFAGDDELGGRAGDDLLFGGEGPDRADGGIGIDECRSVSEAVACESAREGVYIT